MHLLIPYIPLIGHKDPDLDEFTYGDVDRRARKLKRDLRKGDYIFFHTKINSRKCITAYYVVDRVLDVSDAAGDRNIASKYRNPHISGYAEGKKTYKDDMVVFGDPILSRKLDRPLLFDKALGEKLSLSIPFVKGHTDTQCIGSATRQWRELSDKDVDILRKEISRNERKGIAVKRILSTDEVTEVIERDLENFIEENPGILGRSLKLIGRQIPTPVGIIDLLFEDKDRMVVVELKLNKIGRGAVNQLRRYMVQVRKEKKKEAEGIIVCKGVMPAFEKEFRNLKNIRILRYGWKLEVEDIQPENFNDGED